MERCVYINIGGKEYPMRMTLLAREEIHKKYGSISEMLKEFKKEETCITTYLDVTHLLITQGCEYKNVFEKDVPHPENAPVKDGKYIPLTREEIGIGLDGRKVEEIVDKIAEAAGLSRKTEISGKSTSKKNEKTE